MGIGIETPVSFRICHRGDPVGSIIGKCRLVPVAIRSPDNPAAGIVFVSGADAFPVCHTTNISPAVILQQSRAFVRHPECHSISVFIVFDLHAAAKCIRRPDQVSFAVVEIFPFLYSVYGQSEQMAFGIIGHTAFFTVRVNNLADIPPVIIGILCCIPVFICISDPLVAVIISE